MCGASRASYGCRGAFCLAFAYGDIISRFTVNVNMKINIYRKFLFRRSRKGREASEGADYSWHASPRAGGGKYRLKRSGGVSATSIRRNKNAPLTYLSKIPEK